MHRTVSSRYNEGMNKIHYSTAQVQTIGQERIAKCYEILKNKSKINNVVNKLCNECQECRATDLFERTGSRAAFGYPAKNNMVNPALILAAVMLLPAIHGMFTDEELATGKDALERLKIKKTIAALEA